MNEVIGFIKSDIGVISAYVFGLIGIISAYWTYRSFRDGIKQSQRYSVLFETADKKIEKDVLEKEIVLSKREKDDINNDIVNMKKDIAANIPIAAKKAALTSKLEEQIELLKEQYNSVCRTRNKLKEISNEGNFASEIEEIVKAEITPSYYLDKDRQNAKDKFIMIALLITLINLFIPSPLKGLIGIVGITYVISDIRLLIQDDKYDASILIHNFLHRLMFIMSIASNIIVIFYLLSDSGRSTLLHFKLFDCAEQKAVIVLSLFSFFVMFITEIKLIYRIKNINVFFIYLPILLSTIYISIFFAITLVSSTISSRVYMTKIDIKSFLLIIAIIQIIILVPKATKKISYYFIKSNSEK